MQRFLNRFRVWYAGRSDAFKAAWVTAWIAFLTRVTVPILTLLDDTQHWIEGTGDALGRADFVSLGRTLAGAGFALVAGLLNYGFRVLRPNVDYPDAVEASTRR